MEQKPPKQATAPLFLLAGYGISLLGDIIYSYGLNWFLVQLTGKTELLGLVNGVSAIVLIVSNIIAGPIADSKNRKAIMMIADLLSAVVCILSGLLVSNPIKHTGLLILVSSVLNVSLSFNSPAAKAIVPEVLLHDKIEAFNSIQNTLSSLIKIGGPLLGAVLANHSNNFKEFLFINGITFLVSSGLTLFVRYRVTVQPDKKATIIADLLNGLRYVKQEVTIFNLIVLVMLINFFVEGFMLLLPYIVKTGLNGGNSQYSFILSLTAVGGVIGGIILSASKKNGKKEIKFKTDIIILGVAFFVVGLLKNYPALIALAVINGYIETQFNAKAFTLIQLSAKREFLGRVFSVLFVACSLLTPIADFIFGKTIPYLNWGCMQVIALGVIGSVLVSSIRKEEAS